MSNEEINKQGPGLDNELNDVNSEHSAEPEVASLQDAELLNPELATGFRDAIEMGKKVIKDLDNENVSHRRSRTRKQSSQLQSNILSESESENGSRAKLDNEPNDSEDDEYINGSSEDEVKSKSDESDDDFHLPPGLGGRDTRPPEVVRQLRELFSSDEDDDYEDDGDIDFLPENDMQKSDISSKKRRGGGGVMKPLPIKEEARIYYYLAQQEYEKGDLPSSVVMVEEAIKLDPNSKLPYVLLDTIYSDLGDSEKALKAKVAAALLDKNKDDWIDIARISVEQGQLDQAALFYGRAIELDESDYQTMYELVELYMRMSKLPQACELMKKVHNMYPANQEFTSQLARIYMMQGMLQDAVNLFENILLQNKENSFIDSDFFQPFGWSELNNLSELYFRQKAWHKNIRSIKSISRWILERGDETWWDDQKNDAEFDDRRMEIKKSERAKFSDDRTKYILPLDIRVKLLLSRLQLGDIEEAKHHTKFLLEADSEVYLDLFWEVGTGFMELGHYEMGLALFTKLLDNNDSSSELLLAIGKCHMGLSHWTNAEGYFRIVIEEDPRNVEALVGLAETCYALNHDDEARSLIEEIQEIRRELAEEATIAEESTSEVEDNKSTFYKRPQKKRTLWPRRLTKLEKQQAEQKAIATVENNFLTLQRYWSQLAQNMNNMVAVTEWTQIANTLVNMFLSVKRFFHRHGSRLTIFEKGKDADIDARLEKLSIKINENEIDISDDEGPEKGASVTVFRGLPIDTWFDIFMQYALLLAAYESAQSAYQILAAAKNVPIFSNDPKKCEVIKFVHLSCSYLANDPATSTDITRAILLVDTLVNDAYRLHCGLLASGQAAVEIFRASTSQKFFMRQIKGADQLIQGREIKGAANIQTNVKIIETSAILLTLYGNMLLMTRSYSSSLSYLIRAYKIAPKEPLILLSLGIVNIHRALQRQTLNRHSQILQGFSYLLEYRDVRTEDARVINRMLQEEDSVAEDVIMGGTGEENSAPLWELQEVHFNIGRSFHTLGLFSLAAHHYTKVLEDFPLTTDFEYDLRYHAAYNLQSIYSISGNFKLSRSIVDKYLVI